MKTGIKIPSSANSNTNSPIKNSSKKSHSKFNKKTNQSPEKFHANSSEKAIPSKVDPIRENEILNEAARVLFELGKTITRHNKQQFVLNTAFQFIHSYLGSFAASGVSALLKAFNLVSSAKEGMNANFVYNLFLTVISSLPTVTLSKENTFMLLLKYAQSILNVEQNDESSWQDPTWVIVGIMSIVAYQVMSSKNVEVKTKAGKTIVNTADFIAQARLVTSTLGNSFKAEEAITQEQNKDIAELVREAFKKATASNDTKEREFITSHFKGTNEETLDPNQFNAHLEDYINDKQQPNPYQRAHLTRVRLFI